MSVKGSATLCTLFAYIQSLAYSHGRTLLGLSLFVEQQLNLYVRIAALLRVLQIYVQVDGFEALVPVLDVQCELHDRILLADLPICVDQALRGAFGVDLDALQRNGVVAADMREADALDAGIEHRMDEVGELAPNSFAAATTSA